MFANLGSFRDVTLYVLPGNLSAYLIIQSLIFQGVAIPTSISNFSAENWVILLVLAAFASVLGFFQTQLSIGCFTLILKIKNFRSIHLDSLPMPEVVKEKVYCQIKNIFGLEKDTPQIFGICNSFVLHRTNEHSYGYARRLMSYSLFCCALYFPVQLGFLSFITSLSYIIWPDWIIFAISSVLLLILCYRLALHFRKNAIMQVFYLFLSVTVKSKAETEHGPSNAGSVV